MKKQKNSRERFSRNAWCDSIACILMAYYSDMISSDKLINAIMQIYLCSVFVVVVVFVGDIIYLLFIQERAVQPI